MNYHAERLRELATEMWELEKQHQAGSLTAVGSAKRALVWCNAEEIILSWPAAADLLAKLPGWRESNPRHKTGNTLPDLAMMLADEHPGFPLRNPFHYRHLLQDGRCDIGELAMDRAKELTHQWVWALRFLAELAPPGVPEKAAESSGKRNERARKLLQAGAVKTLRQLANRLGCSKGTAGGLQAWKAHVARKNEAKTPKKPKTVSLTDELQELIAEQSADDKRDRRGYKLHIRRPRRAQQRD